MASSNIRQQLLYDAESTWAEAWVAPTIRLQLLAPIDTTSLEQKYLRMEPTQDYLASGMHHRRLPFMDQEFTFEVEAGGHGTATTGALSATQLYTLLALLIGAGDTTSVGTTATGGTAIAPTVAGGTFPSGCLCAIGTNNPRDGRGSGEACVVSGLSVGTLTLFNTLAVAPSSGDVVYAMLQLFPLVDSQAMSSARFLVLGESGVYQCRGCWLKKLELANLNPGEHPRWRITVGVSHVEYAGTAFPSAIATAAKSGAPVHGCTAYIQTVGTATRAIYSPRQIALTIDLQATADLGGESDEMQVITGANRSGIEVYCDLVLDKDAAGTDLWSTWWNLSEESQVYKRCILTLGRTPGRRMAISLPRCKPAHDWARPTQMELDRLNRVKVRLEAEQSTVTTSTLTQAPIVIGIG